MLDGQHRLAGFLHSEGVDFDLPVVAIHNADIDRRGKIFADINSKQVKVSDVHLLGLYYQIRELEPEASATMDVVQKLHDNPDSPLQNKIKMRDTDHGTWVKNKKVKDFLAPHTETGGILHGKTASQQATIFVEYLKALRGTWPDAWGNNKDFMLTKPMGLEIMFSVFGNAKHRVDLNEGRQYTAKAFENQLSVLKGQALALPGGGSIDLDWQAGKLGALSNRVGRAWVSKQLKSKLVQADEPD